MQSKEKKIKVNAGYMNGETGLYGDYDEKEYLNKKRYEYQIDQLNEKISPFENYIWGAVILKNIIVDNGMIFSIKNESIINIIKLFKFKGIKFLIQQIGIRGLLKICFDKKNKSKNWTIKRTYKVIKKEVVEKNKW